MIDEKSQPAMLTLNRQSNSIVISCFRGVVPILPSFWILFLRKTKHHIGGQLSHFLPKSLKSYVTNKLFIVDTVKEIGSGLNGHRKGMMRLLRNPEVQTIVVEHRDRLMRFGFEYVESALAAQNRKVVVIESEEVADDIVRDLHEVIVSMCARLYGKRSAKNRAKKALDAIHNE